MSDDKATRIIERTHSKEFKATAIHAADDLMDVIRDTLIAKGEGLIPAGTEDDWAKFYLPALRRDVYRHIATRCASLADGWLGAFCNALREERDTPPHAD